VASEIRLLRCAIYTRKSTEHGLELEFNSLDAQREACEAYIKSQASQGWRALPQQYNDPAYSGGNLERPALKRLREDLVGILAEDLEIELSRDRRDQAERIMVGDYPHQEMHAVGE
jgi:DNA invertase Pin-like site-specific DNA recombinase